VRFTREEVEEAVRHAKTHYVFGEGRDQHTMGPRKVEDPNPPTCIFSHLGVPVKQDLFPKVCLAQAQEQYADAFCCVSLHDTFRGIPIKSGHPVEVAACMWDITKRREAARLAGRPGLGLYAHVSVGESTESIIASVHPAFGALRRDVTQNGVIAELKVDYERMSKVASCASAGSATLDCTGRSRQLRRRPEDDAGPNRPLLPRPARVRCRVPHLLPDRHQSDLQHDTADAVARQRVLPGHRA
jgi:hypothetical protein